MRVRHGLMTHSLFFYRVTCQLHAGYMSYAQVTTSNSRINDRKRPQKRPQTTANDHKRPQKRPQTTAKTTAKTTANDRKRPQTTAITTANDCNNDWNMIALMLQILLHLFGL